MSTDISISSLKQKVDEFDSLMIEQYHAKRYDLSAEEVSQTMEELKRWLVLCAVNEEKDYGIFGKVDLLWHTFILFTKDYECFCKMLGKFIHHCPAIVSNQAEREAQDRRFKGDYGNFLIDYEGAFGGSPDERLLPQVVALAHESYCAPGAGNGSAGCGCEPKNLE